MKLRRRLYGLAVTAILAPLLALVFWLTALIASDLPGLVVVGVNVHGLNLPSYAADPGQRPAPLSLSLLNIDRQDSSDLQATATPPLSKPGPSPSAIEQPSSAPSPTSTPLPLPLPLPTPLPVVTPTPTPGSATISGQVLDFVTHAPIVAASVSVTPGGQSATTDINGNYSLAEKPGAYTVTAGAVGYNSQSQTVTVNGGQNLNVTFKLVSLTATGSIKGTVTSSTTAAAVAGATVTLSNGLATVTDLNGNYSFLAVLYGNYSITASAVGYLRQTQPVTVKPGHQTTLNFQLTP